MRAAYEANPLLRFKPHPAQRPYLSIDTAIGGLFCGNRFGKTAAGLVWDLIQCCDSEAVPESLQPFKRWDPKEHGPIKGRICAPKFNENIEQVIFPELKKWAPKGQLVGGGWDTAFAKSKRVLTFANGSTIQFLTYDQDVDAHAGAALHFSHFDEEPEGEKGLQLWSENMTRLADHNGYFRLTMTPLFGLSWAYKEIWKKRNLDPDITAIQGDSAENPHVNQTRLDKDAARMSKEEREARRQGKFVHFAGQFYPEFGEDHMVEPLRQRVSRAGKPQAPDQLHDQSIIVGIDPGLNYTGVVWVAFDNDNVAFVFDELTTEQMVVKDIAPKILQRNALWGIEPDYYVIDPSARNRSKTDAERLENHYLRAGIPAIRGQNDRAAGILEVKARLQHKGLVVSRACTVLADEFENYRRDPNSADEFAAIKEHDHELDALRYVCMERLWSLPGEDDPPLDLSWTPGTAPSAEWFDAQTDDTGVLI